MTASGEAVSQRGTVSSLLAGRVGKRPQDDQQLQEATIQLLEQQQNLCSLLREAGNPDPCNLFRTQSEVQKQADSKGPLFATAGPLLVCELRRQASQLGVPVPVLAVKMVLERLMEITKTENGKGEEKRWLLTSCQRVELCVLLESSKDLLSQGAFCPKLLWQEYKRNQRLPNLEVVYHLHVYNILALDFILESDEKVQSWLMSQLKALCGWTPPPGEGETEQVQQKVLFSVVGVLVGKGFEMSHESSAATRRTSLLCCSVLDHMLLWHLDAVENNDAQQTAGGGHELWLRVFDASVCGASVSTEALRRFFMHSLTQTLTYNPRLTVSDAIRLQSEWTFAKASRVITSLFRKLLVIFSVEELLCHLQQVLETHEVNWKHVLCFLSTLLVYNPGAQTSLRELLSRLLTSAFEGYDLENMITAFLLARQGALEGSVIFPSYTDWFKMCFGGGSGYHAASKKSVVFLLKFLSDLVPFEPPQYLKVHVLHPPYVAMKHRNLLMDYISLAKTRLTDLKESLEDMGLYEDVSGAGGASVQCQAVQDVEKAVSLFESTGRISATVMEASIFRRPYFLTRFLPALLTPRVLPVKTDARMSFIEALTKADKIPAPQYSFYVEACQKQRHQGVSVTCLDANDNPVEVLTGQLQEFTQLLVRGADRGRPETDQEVSAQLSRVSHTLAVVFPGGPDALNEQSFIKLHINVTPAPELHVQVINMILRTFCQCMLDSSKVNPPNKQSLWASMFVGVLVGNTQLLSTLLHRLWDLLYNQGLSLSAAHLLGLAALVVHLHASMSQGPLVQLVPAILSKPVPVGQVVSLALDCSTHTNMLFCMRLCVLAVCYGICRVESLPDHQQQDYIPNSLYKKLLYLIPRLLPEARWSPVTASERLREDVSGLWSSVTHTNHSWRNTVWSLWRHAAFSQLEHTPQYQLLLSEWLANELRVQRSEDILSDADRQEYQQWACMEHYLTRAEQRGGCEGDMKKLCSHLLSAIMEQPSSDQSLDKLDPRVSQTGGCLPDILSRVQELVYEMEVQSRMDLHHFLFEFVSMRCSSKSSERVGHQLSLQHTLNTWNRVMLALPAALFIQIKTEGGTTTLECDKLIEHVNQHQRQACAPAGLLSCHLTAHMLRGVLCASVRCECSAQEVNRSWRQISVRCPLLLVSTVHWWERLSPVLLSLWRRVDDGRRLPEQLQLLTDCQTWACSLDPSPASRPPPAAAALQLAASLHRAWRGGDYSSHRFNAALNTLRAELGVQHRQVLVFLLFLCVSNHLSALLYPQEQVPGGVRALCTDLLSVLVDSSDWLLIFKPDEASVYQATTMMTSDECAQLMPWAFYSLLLQQSAELLHRAVCCPGFLHTAVLCYVRLLQLLLEGHTLTATSDPCDDPVGEPQMEHSQFQRQAKHFLLGVISQTSPGALSSSQLRQLESCCTDLDPEVAGALSVHQNPRSLSPEMDFC